METKITAPEGYKNLTFERKEGRDYVDIKYSTDNGDDYIRICVSDIKRVLKDLDITVEPPAKEEHEGHKFKADVSLDVVGQHTTFKEMQYVDLKRFEEYIWRKHRGVAFK